MVSGTCTVNLSTEYNWLYQVPKVDGWQKYPYNLSVVELIPVVELASYARDVDGVVDAVKIATTVDRFPAFSLARLAE
jgi:hypothetical protein